MKALILVVSLLALISLSGCGVHQFNINDGAVQVEMRKEISKASCYQAMGQAAPDYSKLSDMAIVMIEQQKSTAQLVSALTGKSIDPCGGGTNLNDVLIADSQQRNQSLRSITGSAVGVVKFGLGVWGATEVVDSIGKNAGSTSNVETNGGDSSISSSRTNTETNTNTDVSNTGEEGTATTSASEPGFTDPTVDPIITIE